MRSVRLLVLVPLGLLACGKVVVQYGTPAGYVAPASPPETGPGSSTPDPVVHDGLPCDVSQFLQTRCDTCHSSPPVGGAPMALVTYADLMAPARSDPSKTNAQVSITRMQSTSAPMPPGTHLPASDFVALSQWVSAGAPAGTCAQSPPDAGPPPDAGSTTPAPDGGTGSPSGGLPCAVSQFLTANCASCHAARPSGGAPMSLVTYSDLVKPALTNPLLTNAQLSVVRMRSTTTPMPPSVHLAATDIAILADWVASGLPTGSCQAESPDGGFPDTPVQCTSNSFWSGNDGSSRMHPGRACISCHASEHDAPVFRVAGTVYPTLHEPNDCNGTSVATVKITDATGQTVSLTPNSAGNFSTNTSLSFPLHASVTRNGITRSMATPLTRGDCNSCHTQDGASGAPGRIMAP